MNNETIEQRLTEIEARNKKVGLDKAWEVSGIRTGSIALITYGCATAVMWLINIKQPWLSAMIPTLGYVLSAQSLPMLKRHWIHHQLKRQSSHQE